MKLNIFKASKDVLILLPQNEFKRAAWLTFMMLIMALLDMLGVVSVLPFITVLTNPGLIETNLILNKMYETSKIFGIENNKDFLFFMGLLVFFVFLFSLIFKTLTTYFQYKFVHMAEYKISKMLLEKYLQQPYSWFLDNNSADISKTILSELEKIVGGVIKPIMEIISKSAVTLAMLGLLFLTFFTLCFKIRAYNFINKSIRNTKCHGSNYGQFWICKK